MLSLERIIHNSNLNNRVNFEWTKHIRQLKTKPIIHWKIYKKTLFLKKSNWRIKNLICINDEKQKVLKDTSPLIDGLLLSILVLMECLLKTLRRKKSQRKTWILKWKMENKLLKKGTFGTVMLGSWMNQTHKAYSRRVLWRIWKSYWENQAHRPITLPIRQVPMDQLCFVVAMNSYLSQDFSR